MQSLCSLLGRELDGGAVLREGSNPNLFRFALARPSIGTAPQALCGTARNYLWYGSPALILYAR
ncbi:hypothetical protein Tam10B_2077 [Bifidobacterium vansinderenii]|uniref:Uncharacterized protein n=1 Tax=Bifidobacterium vansinderenii TaxID=1984871 RepID=A0A229VVK9_9BIFI|nr:hypothetical protein Tam10B_2077 [Bifidobacterium vansinderenii]